jgi:dTDP-4-amino-4,6-dideoxygalactose transaminase
MPDETMVPMVDLKAQYARIRTEIDEAMARVVASAQFISGEEVAAFEREFAEYCGVAQACGVGNGTDALTVALWALGVKEGDEVVTVANTFVATGEAILINGAKPVFVDVDLETFTMDPASARRALTPRTKVILPVHLFGLPADMTPILELASKKGIPVLEDAAQAHGATYGEKRAGSMGIGGCFSFYPGKNLGAYGDAGAVVSHDANFMERVRRIAHHGQGRDKYDNVVPGTNSRLDALQAAILRVKLRHLPQWDEERRARVKAYRNGLLGLTSVVIPKEREGSRSVWHCYTVRAKDRDGLRDHLQAKGISTAVHYPKPLHLQPAMSSAGARIGDLPASERLAREVMSLPLYPELPMETVDRIVQEIRAFYSA